MRLLTVLVVLVQAGCAVWTVNPLELQRGDPGAMVFGTSGGATYADV